MSAASDWPHADANPVSLPTIVSSTDLFDGELFGDELIDIYNSTVEAHDDSTQEIQNLLGHSANGAKKSDDGADEMLAAMSDGFGAFRPSTSFNDLSTLLTSDAEVATAKAATPISPGATEKTRKPSKKRAADSSGAQTSSKRKAGARRVSVSKKQGEAATKLAVVATKTVHVATKVKAKAAEKRGTPNPFNTGKAAPPARAKAVEATKAPVVVTAAHVPTAVHSSAGKNDDSDFKTLAQAAVSSLMLNAGIGDAPAKSTEGSGMKIDTSTEHIKALTGNNWVAACAGAAIGVVHVPSVADSKANNRARRQNLTPDERARQNRDRNREHARNTRLRKKAYVEELKRTLTELVSQRDTAEFEKRQKAQREMEQREVRFRVIEEFLKLRGRNETNFARWAAILEDGFSLTLPSTDFCKMEQGDATPGLERVLNGVSDVMANASIFAAFLQSFGNKEGTVTFQYQCERKNFFMDGCQAFLEWTATSVGAVAKGAKSELIMKGTVRGKFSPASNKLLSAYMTYDTGAVFMQLQKLAPSAPTAKTELVGYDVVAAQAAANQADAILDSLQMPCLPAPVPAAVLVHSSSSSCEGPSSDKDEIDSDESIGEAGDNTMTKKGTSLNGARSVSA